MAIDKLDRFSTNGATRVDPTPGLRATGCVDGTQVVAGNYNWLLGYNIDKLNELTEMSPSGFEEDLGPLNAIMQYFPNGDDSAWTSPMDDQNIISAVNTKAYVGLCAYINDDKERKLIALDGGAVTPRQFDVYDAATMAVDSNSGDLAGDLPAVGGENWTATCMCTDGTSVYACFQDIAAVGVETHWIQCWDIDGWSVKTGWAATGYTIGADTGLGSATYDYGDICIANATTVACTAPWYSLVGPNPETGDAIHLFTMAGGGVAGAAGAGTGVATEEAHRLTSDGTNIYYTTLLAATVNKAAIANLEAIPADYPYGGLTNTLDILSIGKIIVTTSTGNDTLVFSNDVEEELCTSNTGDARIISTTGNMIFDGLDLWVRGSVLINAVAKQAVFKVAINNVSYQAAATPFAAPATELLVKEVFILDMDNHTVLTSELSPMCFDGRDVYCVGDMTAGNALSGKIYRIPKAVQR